MCSFSNKFHLLYLDNMGAENNFDMDEGTLEIGMGKIVKSPQFLYICYNEKIDRNVDSYTIICIIMFVT